MKMHCKQAEALLDDYLDGQLQDLSRQALETHLERCPKCKDAIADYRRLRNTLRNYPIDAYSAGFPARALRQARLRHSGRERRAFIGGFTSAAAAGLALWVAAGLFYKAPPHSGQSISLAIDESRQVNLVFDVPRNIAEAGLTMELPAHVEVAGHPGQRIFSWKANLAKGRNILTLPVRANGTVNGDLVARIVYEGKTRSFRVPVSSESGESTKPQGHHQAV